MGRVALRIVVAMLMLVAVSFAVTVTVSTPAGGATVASPVTIKASASSGATITGWRIYVDGVSAYQAGTTPSISASVAMSSGTHKVIVRAWDATGAYGSQNLTLSAGTATSTSPVSVTVTSPTGGTVTSPTTLSASATSSAPITGWYIYVDSVSVYSGGATTSISTPVSLAAGTHQVIVRAWNSTGASGSVTLALTVGSSTPGPAGGPTPPPNATVYANLEDKTPWGNCSSSTCSGGNSSTTSYWMAQNQTTPALDGSSAHFFISGPNYATDLFWYKVANNTAPTHFIHDFWVYLDDASTTAAEALEFDLFHVANNRKYMFATECEYWTKTWDVWNEATQHWIHSNATCNKFTSNTWHHVQWEVERVGYQTHYLTVTVDGVTQTIADTYAWQPAPATSWGNGSIGVQVQQDLSSKPASGFHEWVDKHTVYAW